MKAARQRDKLRQSSSRARVLIGLGALSALVAGVYLSEGAGFFASNHYNVDRIYTSPLSAGPSAEVAVQAALEPAEAPELAPTGPQPLSAERTTELMMNGTNVEVAADFALVKPTNARAAQAWLSSIGSGVLYQSPSGFWRVSRPADRTLSAFLSQLEAQALFEAAQPEGIVRAASLATGETRHRAYQWNLDQIDFDALLNSGMVPLADLPGVMVAVIDSGVAYRDASINGLSYVASSDLAGSAIVPGHDYVENDSTPLDLSGHGTHLANIIAADGGILGVAPHVSLMPIRVLDASNMGLELNLADALQEALQNGADVINLSLSFGVGYVPGSALANAVQHCADADVTLVSSSGNQGLDEVAYPAAYAHAIAVGASRLTAGNMSWLADYSNTGSSLDVIAPGGASNLDVNLDGKPDGIAAQSIAPGDPSATHYYLMAGTSQAAAHVSGAAAWLKAAGATSSEIQQALINTSHGTWGSRLFWSRQGLGIIDLDNSVRAFQDNTSAVNNERQYYVNVMPMMFNSNGHPAAVGLIQVIDAQGLPAKRVLVAGHWVGSSNATFGVVTNSLGQATIATLAESQYATTSSPAIFALQVDRIVDRQTGVAPTPMSFYYASNGLRTALHAWYKNPAVQGSRLIFEMKPGVNRMPTWIVDQYLSKPVAALNGFAPIALVFNQPYLEALVPGHALQMNTVSVNLGSSVAFGFGSADSSSVRVGQNMTMLNNKKISLAIAGVDPSMYFSALTRVVPVVNASSASMLTRNQSFLSGLSENATGFGSGIPVVVLGGDGIPVVVLDGDGIPVVVLDGDGIPVVVLDGDGIPVVVLDGDGIPVVVLDGDGIPVVVLGGDGIPVVVLGGDSTGPGVFMAQSESSSVYAGELQTEMLGSSATVPVLVASSVNGLDDDGIIHLDVPDFVGTEDSILLTPDE